MSVNPPLIISRYFDNLIQKIDIYFETHLEAKENHVLQCKHLSSIHEIEDNTGVLSETECNTYLHMGFAQCKEIHDLFHTQIAEGAPIEEYLNGARQIMLRELEVAQAEAFDLYKTISKSRKFTSERDLLSTIFGKKCYVLVEQCKSLYLVKTDFYVDINQMSSLTKCIPSDKYYLKLEISENIYNQVIISGQYCYRVTTIC